MSQVPRVQKNINNVCKQDSAKTTDKLRAKRATVGNDTDLMW